MLKVLRNLFESWKASSSKLRYVEFIINEKEIRLDPFFSSRRGIENALFVDFFFIFILALSIVIFLLPPQHRNRRYTQRVYIECYSKLKNVPWLEP